MLHVRKNAAYTYVFTKIMPALAIIISAIAGNNMTVRKPLKRIVSETAYATLILAVTQARNSLVNLITAWKELTTPKKKKKNFTTTDGNLASSGANRDNKSGNRHIVDGEKDIKKKKTCEAKARNKSNKIKK
jgi:hypothetical protein